MFKLSAALQNQSVISLRTGGKIATSESLIINPNNLKIEGLYCIDQFSNARLVLLTQDIREVVGQGIIVDDQDVLVEPIELIRLQDVLEMKYELVGKPVQTTQKEKVGKVHDFAVDDQSYIVQKLYVSQSLLKSFSTSQLSIDRTEIVEVTNRRVIIKELLKPSKSGIIAPAPIG